MDSFNLNLNIHYTAPREVWERLERLYAEMPHWRGYSHGAAHWYSTGDGIDEKLIWASVEPSGLQFYAQLPEHEWNEWIEHFKNKASEILGYEVGEPEEGYEFYYYD